MAEYNEAPEWRMVLVGKIGSGKSATGNTILGRERFQSAMTSASVTKECEKGEALVNGRKIVVVDTPGFFDTKKSLQEICKEVEKCMKWAYPGPHVILHVMRMAFFTEENQVVVQLIQKIFGHKAKDYMIILLTHKDYLGNKSFQEFLKNEMDTGLQEYIAQCGGRCLAFNNKAQGAEREEQVNELLQMIEALMEKNSQTPYYPEDIMEKEKEGWFARRCRIQ